MSRERELMGRRVKQARTHCNMSQGELAAAVGLRGQSGISMIERGERAPSHDVLLKMCNVLRVDPSWILSGSNPPSWASPNLHISEPQAHYDISRSDAFRKMKVRREAQHLADVYIDAPEPIQDLVQLILFFHAHLSETAVADILRRIAQDVEE